MYTFETTGSKAAIFITVKVHKGQRYRSITVVKRGTFSNINEENTK